MVWNEPKIKYIHHDGVTSQTAWFDFISDKQKIIGCVRLWYHPVTQCFHRGSEEDAVKFFEQQKKDPNYNVRAWKTSMVLKVGRMLLIDGVTSSTFFENYTQAYQNYLKRIDEMKEILYKIKYEK